MNQNKQRDILQAGRLILTMMGPLLTGIVYGQAGGPNDFDLKLIADKKIVRQGDEFNVDAAVAVRKPGVLGWSYGVEHDKGLVEIVSASIVGTDLPTVFVDGFNQTRIISDTGGSKIGRAIGSTPTRSWPRLRALQWGSPYGTHPSFHVPSGPEEHVPSPQTWPPIPGQDPRV